MNDNDIRELEQHLERNNGLAKWEALKALSVIYHQKAEIERLKAEIGVRDKIIDERAAEVLRHDNAIRSLHKQLETAKSEAYREFAKSLKKKLTYKGKSAKYGDFTWDDIKSYELDNLVTELTERREDERK